MAELVVLAFQQMMQREGLRGAIRSRAIGVEPARDDVGAAGDAFQLRLEGGRFLAIGMTQSPVARGELENGFAGARLSSAPASLTIAAQDLAVALRRDRQPMLEIPGGKAAFAGIVAKFDLALFQRLRHRTSR